MIHRALFGSIERFFGVLTEHYAGAFPAWLAPVQVVAIPVTDEQRALRRGRRGRSCARAGVRVEVDAGDDRMQKKIRTHTLAKVPFLLLAGARDAEAGAVSFRFRDGTQLNGVPVAEAVERSPAGSAGGRTPRRRRGFAPGGGSAVDRCGGRPRIGHVVDAVGSRRREPSADTGGAGARAARRRRHAGPVPPALDAAPAGLHHRRRRRPSEGCPFCRIPTLPDEEGLVVARGAAVYAVLNLHPYNPGHLMVVPYRHVAGLEELDAAESAELMAFTRRAAGDADGRPRRTRSTSGMNLGAVAGGSLADHLHQHVVPRWGGDANFIAVIGQTKVIPQLLSETRRLLAEAWPGAVADEARARARRERHTSPGTAVVRTSSGLLWTAHRPAPSRSRCSTSSRERTSAGSPPDRPLARGPRRLPGCGHRRRHRRHRGRGGVVHPARTAVPRRAAGHRLRAVRHGRRRDGARPGLRARRSGRCSTRSATGSPTACCSPRSPGGAWPAASRRWAWRRWSAWSPGQVISYIKARAEGAGLTRGRRPRRAGRAADRVAGRHRARGSGRPVRARHGAVAARGGVRLDGRAAHRRRAPVGSRARGSAGPGDGHVTAPGGGAVDEVPHRAPDPAAVPRPAAAGHAGSAPARLPRPRPGGPPHCGRGASSRCAGSGPPPGTGGRRRWPGAVSDASGPPTSPGCSPTPGSPRAGASSAACPNPSPARRSGSVRTSPPAGTAPGSAGCGPTCGASCPPLRPRSWTRWCGRGCAATPATGARPSGCPPWTAPRCWPGRTRT